MKILAYRLRNIVVLLILVVEGFLPQAAIADPPVWNSQPAPTQAEKTAHPRLESVLGLVHTSYLSNGEDHATALAQKYGIQTNGSEARVIVEALPGAVDEIAAGLAGLGAMEETRNGRLIQVKVPVGVLAALADLPQVEFVRRPYLMRRSVGGLRDPHPFASLRAGFNPLPLGEGTGSGVSPGTGLEKGASQGEEIENTVSQTGREAWGMAIPVDEVPWGAGLPAGVAAAPERMAAAIVSEGVQRIGADVWHNAGITGQGVKIAIIDGGFDGYQALLGTELPITVTTRSFRVDGDLTPPAETHGTAVAEIVHDVAPGAQLYLLNFATDVEWANAVDYAISQGVDIVSSSIGFLPGPLDGTGFISGKVTAARNAGIFWAQSAGNYAYQHWQGTFSDSDGDAFMDFAPGTRLNTFMVPPESPLEVILSWNDWPASAQDYDMFLFVEDNGEWIQVDSSTTTQSGTQPPAEIISGFSPSGGRFAVAIRRFSATRDVQFQLFTSELPQPGLEFKVLSSSLGMPADSPGAVTVGATNANTDQIEPFSSQGPTLDGRVKPDLVAPDGVATATFGPHFFGTSASSPYVAGAAALVKSVNRSFGPAQIQGFLEQNAVDMGPPGKDNVYGAGRLNLPPPGSGAPGPGPGPVGAADAKVEIVFPHDAAGNPTGIANGTLVNIGSFLFAPGSLNPVPCNFGQPVRLFRALNNGVAEQVATGIPGVVTREGKSITAWEFKNVDVAAVTNPLNKYYFFLGVDGIPTNTNVWSHGADARTVFPQQDVPTGVGPLGNTVDAKIEAVFPHDAAGNPRPVSEADLVNIVVDVFSAGNLVSAPPDANLTVRLFRSLNNGMQEFVAVGQKQVVTRNGVSHPRWVFNDVDVAAARNGLNKYYFRAVVDGVTTRSNVWAHGADARTIFPQQDVPAASCQ